jgi:hypothetical protein
MQVVLSVLLLVLGTIFPRSFFREDLGVDAAHTVITAVHPFPRPNERGPWRDRLIRRIKHVPGVVGVTSTQTLPLMGEVDYVDVRRENDPLSATRNAYWIGEGSSRANKGATNEMRTILPTPTTGAARPASTRNCRAPGTAGTC